MNVFEVIKQRDDAGFIAAGDAIRERVAQMGRDKWFIGDIVEALDRSYGNAKIKELAANTGIGTGSLYEYWRVAKTFDTDARARIDAMDNVSWSHCLQAAKRAQLETTDDKLSWLEYVSDNDLSVDDAREELKTRYGSSSGRGEMVAEYKARYDPYTQQLVIDIDQTTQPLDPDLEYTVQVYEYSARTEYLEVVA